MAEKNYVPAVEDIVNRWIVEYYISLAVALFENKQYDDVGALREVLDSVLARCVEPTDLLAIKIKVFDFLCHICDSENPDPVSNQSTTPLESALMLLESMSQECSIPQQDFNNVCTSLKEMMVGMLIKNNRFDKAKEMLIKHFPKAMFDKKAIFMRLINKRSKMHEVIEQIDFQRFREEMFAFCQSVCTFGVPFLHKAAITLVDKKFATQDNEANGSDEQEEAGPSSNPKICTVQFELRKHTIIQKTRLATAYKALAVGPAERTFAQLEEEVEREEQARTNELSLRLSPSPEKDTNWDSERDEFQRDSGSPMEASTADQPPQTDAITQKHAGSLSKTPPVPSKRRLFTVAQLVIEPDSQGSSQCTASQELEGDVTTEEPPHSPAVNNKKDPQNQETDTRANTISIRASTSSAESSSDIGEGSSSSVVNKIVSSEKRCYKSNISFRGKSKRLSSDGMETEAPCKTQVKGPLKQLASVSHSKDPDDVSIIESSLEGSDEMFPPEPHTSSTPHKDSPQGQGPSHSKWKRLYSAAKETKEVWSDEDSYFHTKKKSHNESTLSNSGRGRKAWTASETKNLKDGVKRFGEGNWNKIKAYYNFTDRTNVNLKDKWRTLKKSHLA